MRSGKQASQPCTTPSFRRRLRYLASSVILISILVLGVAGSQGITQTEASWTGAASAQGTLQAAEINPVSNLSCTGGQFVPAVFQIRWDPPQRADLVTGYRVETARNDQVINTQQLGPNVRSLNRIPIGGLSIEVAYDIFIYATGPGDWVSDPWVAEIRITSFGGRFVGFCATETAPRNS